MSEMHESHPMPHKSVMNVHERFPAVEDLIFTIWGRVGSPQSVQQYTYCRLTGNMNMNYYAFREQLQYYHDNAAEERDYIFRDADGNLVDDLDLAETMDMFTGRRSAGTDQEVWLRCRKNSQPGSRFMTMAAYEKLPDMQNLHPLVQKHPTIFDFVFLGKGSLQAKFREAGLELESEDAAYDLLNSAWNALTDDMLEYTRGNVACAPEAATAVSITLSTAADKVQIRCTANATGAPKWFGRLYMPGAERKNAPTIEFPTLLGYGRDAYIYASDKTVEKIRVEIHGLIDDQDFFRQYQNDLQRLYREAKDEAFEFCDRYHLPCEQNEAQYLHYHTGLYNSANGAEILLIVRRNPRYLTEYPQPWTAEPVGFSSGFTIDDVSGLYPGVPTKNYINAWAYFEPGRSFADMVATLKKEAMDEPWNFRNERSNSILANYIRYTVARLLRIEDIRKREGTDQANGISARMGTPIAYNAKRTVAVLNTGLYTAQYKQLVLVFSRSDAGSKWVYRSVEHLGSYALQQLKLDARPCAPVYWDSTDELLYPYDYKKSAAEQRPEINMNHIMNRLQRLPVIFLKRAINSALYGDHRAKELTALLDSGNYGELQDRCSEIPEIEEEIELLIKTKMERALECQNLNFRYIVPTFYPKMERLCFLMPLCLAGYQTPDTALVISVDENKRMYGRTVVTMDMAYRDSRLLCKPEAEWLNPKDILYMDRDEVTTPAAPVVSAARVTPGKPGVRVAPAVPVASNEEPETLVEEPEVPAEEPEVPTEEPEVPAEEPEVPAEEPETLVEEPEVLAEEPDPLNREPEAPAEEPETFTGEDEDPFAEPGALGMDLIMTLVNENRLEDDDPDAF